MIKKNLSEQEQLAVIGKMNRKKKIVSIYILLILGMFLGVILADVFPSPYLPVDMPLYIGISLFPVMFSYAIYLTFMFRCPNCDAIPKSRTRYISVDGNGEIARVTGMVKLNVNQCANCEAFLSMKAWRKHQQSKL
jgi:hypothetical protein